MQVLLAAAQPGFCKAAQGALRDASIFVKTVDTAGDALVQAHAVPYTVLVLDLGLPGARGLEFLRRMRRVQAATPILALVSEPDAAQRTEALQSGANDCLALSADPAELHARVHALARRAARRAGDCLEVEDLVIHCDRRKAFRAGQALPLTEREFVVLEHLLRAQGRPVASSTLLKLVWQEPTAPRENFVAVLLHRLRRKVDEGHSRKLVHSLRGRGYAVTAEPDAEGNPDAKNGDR